MIHSFECPVAFFKRTAMYLRKYGISPLLHMNVTFLFCADNITGIFHDISIPFVVQNNITQTRNTIDNR